MISLSQLLNSDISTDTLNNVFWRYIYTGQTAVKLSGTEAADRAQCAAPD